MKTLKKLEIAIQLKILIDRIRKTKLKSIDRLAQALIKLNDLESLALYLKFSKNNK
jgi:hypothetical protein